MDLNVNEAVEKVVKKVDEMRDEIALFLKEIISIPSITGEEKEIQLFIASKLKEWGIDHDLWEIDESELLKHPLAEKPKISYKGRPMLVGILRGVGGGRSLIFNGHIDIIPPGPRSSWKHDPFAGVIENGFLYGRGASDMKSGVAAYTMAVKVLLDAGFKPKGDVYLHYVIDEEYSSNGTLAALLRGYVADGAINAEASDLEVQPAVSGSMWFTIEVTGKTASMSRIWEGVSAIEKACKIVGLINKLYRLRVQTKRHSLYPDVKGVLALFLGVMEAGTYPSALPDKAILKGRMGLLPGETIESAINELRDYIYENIKDDAWLSSNKPVIKQEGYAGEGVEIDINHSIVQTIIGSYEDALGIKPVIKGHEGATDMRILVKMGIPTVCFGPGMISEMHAYNEKVRVEDLIKAVKVLSVFILRWCDYEYVG